MVSTGNEAALSAFDLVEWYLEEGGAEVMLLYLEAIREAPTFRRVAAKAADLGRPIVVAKIGQSDAGRRAAAG
jgi:acetate---CoA ligase (ADP-forming)